jgi:hypothetical protein
MDMRARGGVIRNIRYFGEVLLPPGDYMRARFGGERPSWLPWLYVRRVFAGIIKRIGRSEFKR